MMQREGGRMRGIYEKIPGSGIWWIRYTDASGRLRREKAGTKSAAILLYRKRKQEALEGCKLPERLRRRVVLFREIADDALEYSRLHKRSYRQDCYRMARLIGWFGNLPADSVTPEKIEQRFSEQHWAPATINRCRALLSLAYRLAIRNGKVRENPARLVPHRLEDNARLRFLDKKEEACLRVKVRELYPEHEPEFDLALYTGMRRGEQYGLCWEDVDFERRLFTIPRSKNGTMRSVPLNATALHALVELHAGNGSSELVCGGAKSPRHWFEPAARAAGLTDFTWHCLRHTFASRLVMAGVDIRTVAELLGHKTLAMTMRYAHLAPDHQRAAVEKLERTDTRTDTSAETVIGYLQ
ncbi:MAG TPA: site-specific integrase [Terriglobales bacterium]|nr:site-specific integrase [Terriglobales bacterium]